MDKKLTNSTKFDPHKINKSRRAVVSREAKKKQHACASSGLRDHYSELFTRMATVKLKCCN